MAIKLGEKILRDMYLGDKRIVKAYFGEKLVFEADKPIFVDYIESTGTQWIDTEYIMTSDNQEVECEFQYTDSSGTQCLSGTLPGANRGITPYTNNDGYFYVHTGQPAVLKFTNFDYSVKHSLYVKAVVGQGVYGKLDNTEQTTTTVLTTINKSNAYFLFCRNNGVNNKPDTSYFKGRIYRFKMKDDGVVVRDLKPCLHPKTFEACMYDTVSHKYFYNKGTGNFIPAPRFVEYLESDGNQWIDTQYIISSENIKLNIKTNISTLETLKTLCGSQIDGYNGFGGLIYYNSSYGGLGVCVGTNYNNNTYSPITAGVDYEIEHTANNGVATLTKNGVKNTTTYTGTLISNNTWYLFWSNGGTSAYKIKAKIYYARLEDNGVVVRDLRPCLDSNNVACMYDMVTGTYFYNKGTGEFKHGGLV